MARLNSFSAPDGSQSYSHLSAPREAWASARPSSSSKALSAATRTLGKACVGGSLNQLRGDTNAVTRTHHRAFDDGVHAEFARNFRQRPFGVLVAFDGSVGNHAKGSEPGQLCDQLVGHAIAEVFLLWVTREIVEW